MPRFNSKNFTNFNKIEEIVFNFNTNKAGKTAEEVQKIARDISATLTPKSRNIPGVRELSEMKRSILLFDWVMSYEGNISEDDLQNISQCFGVELKKQSHLLFAAIEKNDISLLNAFLGQDFDANNMKNNFVNARNASGESPLHVAASSGNTDAIFVLLENGANLDKNTFTIIEKNNLSQKLISYCLDPESFPHLSQINDQTLQWLISSMNNNQVQTFTSKYSSKDQGRVLYNYEEWQKKQR